MRTLLDEAIGDRYREDPAAYERVVRRGRRELAERAAERAAAAA